MAKPTLRPGRTLTIFMLVAVVLYGLAALGGTWKPRLGLDLEGGTRITLVADGSPSSTKLSQAANIIDERVNGSGVTESQVSTQGGTNIVVEIPGKTRQDLVDSVKRTAQLRFRLLADCTQLTQGPCQASGLPQKPSPSATPTTTPTTSPPATPTGKGTTSGHKSPTKSSTKKSGNNAGEATATPNPRPAPAFALDGRAKKKPGVKKSPSAAPTTSPTAVPTTTPSTPAAADQGAALSDYKAWSKDPGTDWQLLFAVSSCAGTTGQALVPPIANTMDVAHPPSSKELQKQLGTVKKSDLVPAVDEPNRPLISCDDQGNKYLLTVAAINGDELKSASYGTDQQSLGNWVVQLGFKSGAASVFGKISQALINNSSVDGGKYAGGQFAIVLDGKTLSVAGFSGVILDGNAQITGSFTQSQAKSLANSLKYGALPVKFKKDVSVQTIGPSLAGNQLSAGILAGAIGLAIVMLYCLLYYRGLGTVVIASLVIAALVTYAIVLVLAKTAGFALTLPGIAGLIVAVGITADSFIVYFERIRDEMRAGKSMRVAVQAGWLRARNTCLAADSVSFLAALVLYIFAIGVVKGFAFALGISTLIDVAVFFWFTHPMITLLSRRPFFNSGHRLSGLSPETLGIDGDQQLAGGRV